MDVSFYEFAITNTKNYIQSEENKKDVENGTGLDAFNVSQVLAVLFCKNKEEIIIDLVK